MPIYEYICMECKTRFDALRAMSQADDPIACKACDCDRTSRAISVFYASSEGRSVAGRQAACSSCSTGACSTCRP